MSGPQFFETRMGQHFYDHTVPRIADALEQIAKALVVQKPKPAPLSNADIEQIVEAIEHFVIGPGENPELQEVWQPYIDKLNAQKTGPS